MMQAHEMLSFLLITNIDAQGKQRNQKIDNGVPIKLDKGGNTHNNNDMRDDDWYV